MMNYMPMLPNLYCVSPLQAPSYVAPAPQREMKSYVNAVLLNTISQALRVSLNNYQQHLTNSLNQHEKQQKQAFQAKEKMSNAEKVIEIIISEEEEGEKAKQKLNQNSIKNTLKSPLLSEKNTALTVQIPTDDQNILESKETCNKKDSDLKKKNRKNNKVDTYQVIVPEIDLIETANLPSIKVYSESLARKKQQLMNRRVRDWAEFAKGKKERREIRMLGN